MRISYRPELRYYTAGLINQSMHSHAEREKRGNISYRWFNIATVTACAKMVSYLE